MFQCAAVTSFLKAAVEGIQRHIQIVKKNKSDQREGEIASGLRQGVFELRAVDEFCDIKKHGRAEQRFNCVEDENRAVGARDEQVAPEKEPHLAENATHEETPSAETVGSFCAGSVLCVSRRKTSSS